MIGNDIPTVHWLGTKDIIPTSKSSLSAALKSDYFSIAAGRACTPEILEWLTRNGFSLNDKAFVYAAGQATLATMEWLHSKGYIPSFSSYYDAFFNGRDESLEWLYAHNVPIIHSVINEVISLDKIIYLDWLESHGVDFTILRDAGIAHSVETQKWLLRRGIIPDDGDIIYMTDGGYFEVIKYLWDIGIKHSDMIEIIELVVSRHELDMLKWIVSHGYTLNAGHLFLAADEEDCLDTLELVYQNIPHKHSITKQSIIDMGTSRGYDFYDDDPLNMETRPAIREWILYHNISY